MRYMVDCWFPGLDEEWLGDLSREAQRDFGESGYHFLASVSKDRIFGIFEAEGSSAIQDWLYIHGGTVDALVPLEIEAGRGEVLV